MKERTIEDNCNDMEGIEMINYGCECCDSTSGGEKVENNFYAITVSIVGDSEIFIKFKTAWSDKYYNVYFGINYCPFCGTKLKERR